MKKIRFLFLILIAFIVTQGCGKGSVVTGDPITYNTKTELLAKSNWKFTAAFSNGVDVSGSLAACQKNNTILFVNGGGGSIDEGPTKCNTLDPQTSLFTWNFDTAETTITISTILFTGGSNLFTIVSLTDASLVVSQNMTIGGTPQNVILNFSH